MLRTRLVAAASVVCVAGFLLAGCSGSSLDMFKSSPPPPQALQFESEPPGASVQTSMSQGQSCVTPCSLTVPVVSQTATFTMNGYVPQTLPIALHEREHSMFSHPPPDLVPNPAVVALQPVPPPPRKARPKPRKMVAKPPRAAAQPGSIAAPEPPAQQQDNAFPPPPAPQPAGGSPFPPPPPTR